MPSRIVARPASVWSAATFSAMRAFTSAIIKKAPAGVGIFSHAIASRSLRQTARHGTFCAVITGHGGVLIRRYRARVTFLLGALPSKHAATAVKVRALALLRDQLRNVRAAGNTLELPRLIVEPLERAEFLVPPEPGILHSRFQDADGFVINPERNRIRMPVLAAMREREA